MFIGSETFQKQLDVLKWKQVLGGTLECSSIHQRHLESHAGLWNVRVHTDKRLWHLSLALVRLMRQLSHTAHVIMNQRDTEN